MSRVKDKLISLKEAAKVLGVSYRQSRRIYKRFLSEGAEGILHRSRGRPSNHKIDEALREAVIKRYVAKYVDFGPTLAAEKLDKDGYKVKSATLRKWLITEDIWKRRRKRKKHRQRREPKAHFGQMVQLDGSHHCWFEGRGGASCLMNMVDDATKISYSIMNEEETTEAAMRLVWGWIMRYGIPQSLYCDLKNVYVTDKEPSIEEQLAGKKPLTAFGRACEKLQIEIKPAYTAQAKGRVERSHGVYQDRFVKELRLANVSTIMGANRILENSFVDELNEKFSRAPRSGKDVHRPVPKGLDLRTVFCWEVQRTVGNDWVVRYHNRYFQILRGNKRLPRAGGKVTVSEWLDGSIHLIHAGKELQHKEIGLSALKKTVNG